MFQSLPQKDVPAQNAEILKSFTHKCLSFIQTLLAFMSAGDEWLFEGCIVSFARGKSEKAALDCQGPDCVVPHGNCLCEVFSTNVQNEPVRF